MSTNKGCVPGKSSLIGLGSVRDCDGCAILHTLASAVYVECQAHRVSGCTNM